MEGNPRIIWYISEIKILRTQRRGSYRRKRTILTMLRFHFLPQPSLILPRSRIVRGTGISRNHPFYNSKSIVRTNALDTGTLLGTGLFFAPGAAILAYAFFKGKGNLTDGLSKLLTEVSQGYFQPSMGGENIPVAEGELSDLAGDEPLFKALYQWFIDNGPVFKLAFGPKAFIVISDPQVVKHLLKDNAFNYDKGVLAEILEPIMGKGLIPADLETWKTRRRQIVPAFHQAYLENCVKMFGECTGKTLERLSEASESSSIVDMEKEFLNLGLDIIGIGVFNYDFGSINQQNPVIQAVYGVLKEAEHRSTFYIPYWNLPISKFIVPRQIQFQKDIKIINDCLDDLIDQAKLSRSVDDIEALQARDYSKVNDASLLRFLVDMRDADLEQKQLRDDLMTMLIAGHETTAAVLTWTIFLLATHPEVQQKVVEELKHLEKERPGMYFFLVASSQVEWRSSERSRFDMFYCRFR